MSYCGSSLSQQMWKKKKHAHLILHTISVHRNVVNNIFHTEDNRRKINNTHAARSKDFLEKEAFMKGNRCRIACEIE